MRILYGDVNQKTSRVVIANGGAVSASGAIGFGVKPMTSKMDQKTITVFIKLTFTQTMNRFILLQQIVFLLTKHEQ
jgi:hypothetical protein